jgi:hypothetical protein
MSNQDTITYTCPQCGYGNAWTRAEILQRGRKEVYRGDDWERYTLPCKNKRTACSGRHTVEIKRSEPDREQA